MLPRPKASIVEQDVDDGLLLLRDTGEYVVLNSTAAIIWKLLQEKSTLDEIIDELCVIYNAPEKDECRTQVQTLLNRLSDGGFLSEAV